MKKYGFLFGAGAEAAYGLPSGGKFALDIFRQDTSDAKQNFKDMRDLVKSTTLYANHWLPENYKTKNISVFGKSIFQNIIASTVEHRKNQIIEKINAFDNIARKFSNDNVESAFKNILGDSVSNISLAQDVAYNDVFKNGNELFKSNYFSALLMLYRDRSDLAIREMLGHILLAIMQLQLGALSEEVASNINDNLFAKKDDKIDFFDNFGKLIKLDYNAAGVSGLELLFDMHKDKNPISDEGVIVYFAQAILEEIYASVLDYKTLIDANWHYLYTPSSDWAKFCKIAIFLLTVHDYITKKGTGVDKNNVGGYYNILRQALDNGRYEASVIATTNYNNIIGEILKPVEPIVYLNGSVSMWYDPYLNKIGTKDELDDSEHHILVPLLFTQSGTKPITSINMSEKYVDMYRAWKDSNAVVVVGFGFGADDEHINGILRTLVNDDGKELKVVTLKEENGPTQNDIANKLKAKDANKIEVIIVDSNGTVKGTPWTECI